MAQPIKVLVTGATGKQGGAVAHHLREKGHKVRALTRRADSAAAQALAAKDIEIALGNLEDRRSLERALEGMDALFLMGSPYETGVETEIRQGVTAGEAAKTKNVYVVYTSVGSADTGTGVPHFESKYEVEKHIRTIGVPAAIIAPVYFMENATTLMREQLSHGVYAVPLDPNRKLAQIAVDDIAEAAVAALEHPERFAGTRYDLAGDDLTGNEAVAILSRVSGRPFSYFQVPIDVIRQQGEELVLMFEWFDRVGYKVDRDRLVRDFPEVTWHSFEAWAKEQEWSSILANAVSGRTAGSVSAGK